MPINRNFPSIFDDLDSQFWGDEEILKYSSFSVSSAVSLSPQSADLNDVGESVWEIKVSKKDKVIKTPFSKTKPTHHQELKIGQITNIIKRRGFIVDSSGEVFSFYENNDDNLKIGDRVSYFVKKGKNDSTFNKVHKIKKLKLQKYIR